MPESVRPRLSTAHNDHAWWASLRHGGLLIAPSRLEEYFRDSPEPLPESLADRLRADVTRLGTGTAEAQRALLDTVLERVCGLQSGWTRGSDVDTKWSRRAITGEIVKPRRLWESVFSGRLPVFVDDEPRLGIGRGRRSVSRIVEWLRAGDEKIALITNGRQWRLIYAGLDYDAWVEWDVDLWFEEGRPGPQVDALRVLLARRSLVPPAAGERPALLAAIEDSRRGQAELSSALGERVREAVEVLIQAHSDALQKLVSAMSPSDIYLAATRVVMRMVVVLFAEARDLLPRDNPIYHGSYGLQGLRELLDKVSGAGAAQLQHRYGSWPRILGLFRLIYEGSHHPDVAVPRYGGGLFAPGSLDSTDPVDRTLAVFENAESAPNDHAVSRVLDLLCRTTMKARQGRAARTITVPVDFADLSSEYIGILYEGLLDYELRRATDEAIVFLAIGDQPALPLSRLEAMDDQALAALVEKMGETRKLSAEGGDEESEDEGEDAEKETEEEEDDDHEPRGEALGEDVEPEEIDAEPEDAEEREDQVETVHDEAFVLRERALDWAKRAVTAGGLVKAPRSKRPEAKAAHAAEVERAAQKLIARIVHPGEWFLVLWGGTRKGSGTFYTRPQLAVPTVQRTLRPLAFDPPPGPDGQPNEDAPASDWIPRAPEAILALKVCDPAVGSGSFAVAALRFLTDALWQSLLHHGWIREQAGRLVVENHTDQRPPWFVESVRDLPVDAPDPEGPIRARLKRVVVERCLYGVDIDPLAIELARLSLWVETMDRSLPFEFLDHKFRPGNSLVGCWFDRVRDYPVLAWERDGGDKNHEQFVHHYRESRATRGKSKGQVVRSGDRWDAAIKAFYAGTVKPALRDWLLGQRALFDQVDGRTPEALHDEAVAVFRELHAIPVQEPEERARFYRDRVRDSEALAHLRAAFDTWCALWFWLADRLDVAPLPATFGVLSEDARRIVETLRDEHRFFHWELEFPDVFAAPGGGFDAMIGNPPWEIQKPNSKEFFSNVDPLYRSYGKQEALRYQKAYFERSADDERAWVQYVARFKALSNWNKHAASPFGDGGDGGDKLSLGRGAGPDALLREWQARRAGRAGYADPEHPFHHQGSADINTYKMFLEQAHALLRDGGQLGLLVPSGLYTDKGSTDLRVLLLNRCRWRWLFGFENRDKIFDIHRSFKFCPVIVQKGGTTDAVRTAFMRHDLGDWEEGERHVIPYPRTQVEVFSPRTRAILEVRHPRDLEVLEKIYASSVLLGDQGPDGWGIRYATEFHMTNDSKLFPPRPWWEAQGYQPDEYGRWIKFREKQPVEAHPKEAGWIRLRDGSGVVHEEAIEDIALPLYEGRMIGQFDFSQKGWVEGKGRGALWRDVSWEAKTFEPQYLMARSVCSGHGALGIKTPVMNITSATNARTVVAAVSRDIPCNHSLNPLRVAGGPAASLALSAVLNSLAFDFEVRHRLGGLNLSFFVLDEVAMPPRRVVQPANVARLAASLNFAHPFFSAEWSVLCGVTWSRTAWRGLWAVTTHDRLRLRCVLDAVIAAYFGLDWSDLAWVLRACDYPSDPLRGTDLSRTLDPKGFWRVDKDKDPELRHTVLTLVALHDLKETIKAHGGDRDNGIRAFCNQNDGEGWMLPEALCLADYGLGHDERAKKPQPVSSRLGERFLPWQLEQSVEESWAECERHARNILGEEGFAKLKADLAGSSVYPQQEALSLRAAEAKEAAPAAEQSRLFRDAD